MKKDLTNKIGYIYKITNPNNKIYIGQTINFIKRKSQYKNLYCKGQTAIYNSIKKYGWDNFEIEILQEYEEIATGIASAGGTYTPGTLSTFNQSDYENTNVKHGN